MGARTISRWSWCACAVLIVGASGCSRKGKQAAGQAARAEGAILLYNSVGEALGVEVRFGDEPLALDLDLEPGGARRISVTKANAVQVKVVRPAARSALSQTVDVPPAGTAQGDVLLDLGGRASLHRWPLYYVPLDKSLTAQPPAEVVAANPPAALDGPSARYDLSFRAVGINARPHSYKAADGEPDRGMLLWVVVDETRREQLQRGGDLPMDRD